MLGVQRLPLRRPYCGCPRPRFAFEPFSSLQDATPTLYFGFDARLPADVVSMYLDITETAGLTTGPPLVWEYWTGSTWSELSARDETADFALPGIVKAAYPGTDAPPSATVIEASESAAELIDVVAASAFRPGDTVSVSSDSKADKVKVSNVDGATVSFQTPLAETYTRAEMTLTGLARFGTPRESWVRARLRIDGEPRRAEVNGTFLNTAWVSQVQTIRGEVLGGGSGQPNQIVNCRKSPVLPGQSLEVRELSGPRAEVEKDILRAELATTGLTDEAVRVVADPVTGKAVEVWVQWQEQSNLYFSRPTDRHYVVERSRGRILFGDDVHGRIPPAGADNLRLAMYTAGGGAVGNVPKGTISQLLSGILATDVANVRAAEGGADTEAVTAVPERGSAVVRHQLQALSVEDYEHLALEASPGVAFARAQPTTDANGRTARGWVRVIIVPQSFDPRPTPSFGLRREVENYLRARCPASMARRVTVVAKKLFYSHNFGHNGPLAFYGLGINGKMSELQAAMGLTVFPYINFILEERKKVIDFYNKNLNFSTLRALKIRENTDWNYSYYPVVFESEEQLLKAQKILNENNIFPRRYFYPSLNTIEYTKGKAMPISGIFLRGFVVYLFMLV